MLLIARGERRPAVLWAHGLWGALGLSICLLLALAGGGHPPPIVFVPVVVAVWATGHGAIWATGRIAARGRRSREADGRVVTASPLLLKLALALTGLAGAIGLVQVVASLLLSELYPFRLPGLWVLAMAIWTAHAACFVGLLLRKRWSRLLCAALPLAWAALLAKQIVEHLASGTSSDPGELLIAVALIVLLVVFGGYLAASKRVKAQFET